MVLKVEKPSEETKPILRSNDSTDKCEPDLKIEDAFRHITNGTPGHDKSHTPGCPPSFKKELGGVQQCLCWSEAPGNVLVYKFQVSNSLAQGWDCYYNRNRSITIHRLSLRYYDKPEIMLDLLQTKENRSMIADPVKTENPELVLELFSTAIKMQNMPLAKECIEILNRQLDRHNALLIMRYIYNNEMMTPLPPDPLNLEPSAPPILENDTHFNEDWVQDLRDNLRNNCLLEIDKNADYVLKQKEILELSYRDVLAITTRDTLQVSNEMLVYSVAVRWAIEECKRRRMDPNPINIKTAMLELLHASRYGLMSKKDFGCTTIDGVKGPRRSGFLEEKEVEIIQNYIKKKAKNRSVQELPHKASLPRRADNEKSNAFHSGISGDSVCSAGSSCDKFVINFLTCWTVIFD